MATLFETHVHAGLSGIELTEESFELGEGVVLSKTYAHLMSPFLMAFKPASAGMHHPPPWKHAAGGASLDINAELFVPKEIEDRFGSKIAVAHTIVFLLRLGVNPAVTLPVFSNCAFSQLPEVLDNEARLLPHEVQPRHFQLGVVDGTATAQSVGWVAARWQVAHRLIQEDAEFALAVDAIDGGQFVRQSALALVSLWAAIESLFSPSTVELKFRVSALAAAFLEPPGAQRLQLQKSIAKLYDKRSAAAHGRPKHEPDDLLATFSLLRRILIGIVDLGYVPTKEMLEESLFGEARRST